jgi:hypothetical protein
MKYKALFGLRLVLGLLLFASGSGQTGGLGLVVQQIETIGPRQWLSLMAGSIIFSAPVIPPPIRSIRRWRDYWQQCCLTNAQLTPSEQTSAHPP